MNKITKKTKDKVIMYDEIDLSLKDIPVDTPIIFMVELEHFVNKKSIIKKGIEHGFRHPIITKHYENIDLHIPYLCLFHKHDHLYGTKVDQKLVDDVEQKIKFCVKNYKKLKSTKTCQLYLTFPEKTLTYLHDYMKVHKFKVNNKTETETVEQREISGKFILTPISENTVTVYVDEKSTDMGGQEEADYMETIASFHTHPLEAYQKYKVCLAYPSVDDYLTILHVHGSYFGMFHIVATLEGLYLITISPEFKDDHSTILSNFDKHEKYIKENYSIDYPICDPLTESQPFRLKNIKKYINTVNSFKKKYFKVKFLSWEEAKEPVLIEYKPLKNNSCIISDEQLNFHSLILRDK
jgi:hypothetical protein